ncbi:phage replisome organizer N-terminal domain-containing protein [Paenibacillus sp. ACRRX]|uniref:phage replisome organizer N-terminal domain-containing protein n=1 Tax=Paenibacillus sp. ACRRX TaxID=2918206 RepID=UPI001EF6E5C7|nr:phage replisome organizer N-terminal domain-containing protein [Paenibacillus sp. ACRRX]MCG7410594.1 phage replisome organizer N-terminal domain-containing protein [Paenibacillus sp. ACRRX]
MSEIKWIKLSVGLFDDEKIKVIESMPEADSIIVIWLKLMTMAGKVNAGGFIMLTEKIPYTEDLLISLMGRPITTVKMALKLFQQFEMIEMWEDGRVSLPNWEKHQNIDGMEKVKEQARLRKKRQRERQKELLLSDGMSRDNCVTDVVTVTGQVTSNNVTNRDCHATDIELDIDIDIDKDITLYPHHKNDDEGRYFEMACYFHNKVMEHAEANKVAHLIKKPNMKKWADEFRKIVELDKRALQELKAVIDWCTTDSFWQTNILSPKKLREKYPELGLKMHGGSKPTKSRTQNNKALLQKRMGEIEHEAIGGNQDPFFNYNSLPDGRNDR